MNLRRAHASLVWVTRASDPSTAPSSVVLVVKTIRRAPVISVTLSLPSLFSMLVCVRINLDSPSAYVLGFIRKIQKLLESVCHNCGKILVDEVCHPPMACS
jgi:hypothetical protein